MRPIMRVEVMPLAEYEEVRDAFRARVIAEKKPRRVDLGEHISVLFENRDTVLLQIHEMLVTERISTESGIAHEIATYNELIPGNDELSITLFVQIADKPLREKMLVELAGLEDTVALEIDGKAYAAKGKREGAEPGRTTAVHYLKIPLDAAAAGKLRSKSAKAALVVTHPKHPARTELRPETLEKLAKDLDLT